MHLLGFGISFVCLTLVCIFGIAAIATNSWWKNNEGNFKAGVWQQCDVDTRCVDYGTDIDRSLGKLMNVKNKERLVVNEYHLNVVRGMAVFHLIVMGVMTFTLALFIYTIKSQTAKSIPILLQTVVSVIILVSATIGLTSSIYATDYKKIFGYHFDGMKLGGSWVSFLLCSVIAFIVGGMMMITLCYHCIKDRRTSEHENDVMNNNKPSSRKGSEDIVANYTAQNQNPYVQYFPDQKDKGIVVENDDVCEENEKDYKIPELEEVMSNYEELNDDQQSSDGSREKRSYTESDYTLAQLSDYSSQPISGFNSDFTISNQRSASFSNQLYDDVS